MVVPAGGRGTRMGTALPKQFLELHGAPLIVHTLRALLACPLVREVVPVVPPTELDATRALLARHGISCAGPVAGGATRQESVYNGIQAVSAQATVIAVHDAARPFPDPRTLAEAIRRAGQDGVGVVVGRPCHDTIKRVDARGRVTGTPDRTRLWQAFTPQVFPAKMIRDAYGLARQRGTTGTDDAALAEAAGATVTMLEGRLEALKVTTPQDLLTARAWLDAES